MRALKYFASFAVGLVLYFSILERQWGAVIVSKTLGGNQPCPWGKLLTLPWLVSRFAELQKLSLKQLTAKQEDPLGI